jgi:hypothetical protein
MWHESSCGISEQTVWVILQSKPSCSLSHHEDSTINQPESVCRHYADEISMQITPSCTGPSCTLTRLVAESSRIPNRHAARAIMLSKSYFIRSPCTILKFPTNATACWMRISIRYTNDRTQNPTQFVSSVINYMWQSFEFCSLKGLWSMSVVVGLITKKLQSETILIHQYHL